MAEKLRLTKEKVRYQAYICFRLLYHPFHITIEEAVKEVPKEEKKEKKPRKPRAKKEATKPVCPICKKGSILRGKTAYGCSEYKNGCTFRLDYATYGEGLTDEELTKVIGKL